MAPPPSVTPWTPLVATQLSPLSRPQATALAWWRLGMGLARSWGRTAVSPLLASRPHRQEHTGRQQLREWCYAAVAKRSDHRQSPARAVRLWLASVGGVAEDASVGSTVLDVTALLRPESWPAPPGPLAGGADHAF